MTGALVNYEADQDAAEIGRLYGEARSGMVASVCRLVEAGQRLADKKAELGHGRWLPWLTANADALGFGERTAQLLIKGAQTANPKLASDLTETAARQLNRMFWGHNVALTQVGASSLDERGDDAYWTPAGAVLALLNHERFSGRIWEPACGAGNIVKVLRERGHKVVATDLHDYGCPDATSGVDFLQQRQAPKGVATIVTNPPFKDAADFVRHALTLAPRVVMVLRLLFYEGQGRSDILDGGQLARVYAFSNRLEPMHRHGWDGIKTESNGVAYAWFVWDRAHKGPTTLHRISWGKASNVEAAA
jgi:Protein of unknown function (DUF3102)